MTTLQTIMTVFIAIGVCLGIAAFILVLTSKQNCQTKEGYKIKSSSYENF